MARIRSVHPGQWSDEDFVECSYPARLLAIAVRNEADDQGIFEWKPTTLKMRLFPADNVDIAALLSELEARNLIKSFEHEGRKFGAIRNFLEFQKPKKPTVVHVLPDEFRTYVASKSKGSEPKAVKGGRSSEPRDGKGGGSSAKGRTGSSEGVGKGEGEKGSTPPKSPPAGGTYAFDGKVIRLTAEDFDRWTKGYPNLDLRAELTALDDWYAENLTPAERKKWFQRCSAALAKKNAERKASAPADDDAGRPEPASPEKELEFENRIRAAKGQPPRRLDGSIDWDAKPGVPASPPTDIDLTPPAFLDKRKRKGGANA